MDKSICIVHRLFFYYFLFFNNISIYLYLNLFILLFCFLLLFDFIDKKKIQEINLSPMKNFNSINKCKYILEHD